MTGLSVFSVTAAVGTYYLNDPSVDGESYLRLLPQYFLPIIPISLESAMGQQLGASTNYDSQVGQFFWHLVVKFLDGNRRFNCWVTPITVAHGYHLSINNICERKDLWHTLVNFKVIYKNNYTSHLFYYTRYTRKCMKNAGNIVDAIWRENIGYIEHLYNYKKHYGWLLQFKTRLVILFDYKAFSRFADLPSIFGSTSRMKILGLSF